jgi:hypothetical protein
MDRRAYGGVRKSRGRGGGVGKAGLTYGGQEAIFVWNKVNSLSSGAAVES